MRNKLSEIILRTKIEKDNAAGNRQFLSWNNINKIALIVGEEQALSKHAVDKYIERIQKYVEVFYIELGSKEPTYNDWECFVKKDKSFFNLPKKNRANAIRGRQFDIVINTCEQHRLFSTAVTLLFNASFRCGSSSHFKDTDLIVVRSKQTDVLKYLDDVITYLKMIKPGI